MKQVKILTKMYASSGVIASRPDPAKPEDLTLLMPPFTYTAKFYVGEPTGRDYPNDIQNYYFRLWTIGNSTQTNRALSRTGMENELQGRGIMEATAWYSPGTLLCAVPVPIPFPYPADVHLLAVPDKGTFAYIHAFVIGNAYSQINPIQTFDPQGAFYSGDPKTVETTHATVTITAKDNISPDTVFVEWVDINNPSFVSINNERRQVTIPMGKWASLDARYKTRT